ncbi:hypothetical protein DEO72_LG2g1756 [Vigna unguiculata]|uniref:Uncharacterized protein n=1 Tax=Vigna unguiculata TaxID=3917 RepID=A0A4D6KX39_VIGUN|nr:hypothetical protein DEO72_LG2g1756 [Vigna unguiculata]
MPKIVHHSRIHTSHDHHHPHCILLETCISSRWNSEKCSHCYEPPMFCSPLERTCNANSNVDSHCMTMDEHHRQPQSTMEMETLKRSKNLKEAETLILEKESALYHV